MLSASWAAAWVCAALQLLVVLSLMGTLQRRFEANQADSARLRAEDGDPELELAVMSGR